MFPAVTVYQFGHTSNLVRCFAGFSGLDLSDLLGFYRLSSDFQGDFVKT